MTYILGIDPALGRTAVCRIDRPNERAKYGGIDLNLFEWECRIAQAPKPVRLARSRIGFARRMRKIFLEWPDPAEVVIEVPPRKYSPERKMSAERAAHICLGLWGASSVLLLEPGRIRKELLGNEFATKTAVKRWAIELCKAEEMRPPRGGDEIDAFAAAWVAAKRVFRL